MSGPYGSAAARRFRTIGLESRIEENTPHGLITLLFDGAIERIELARSAIEAGDRARKISALTKAHGIVDGLRQSLDLNAGGDLARRLDALYDYVGRRLLHANLHDDRDALSEAATILGDLRSAWVALPASA